MLLDKISDPDTRHWYIQQTVKNGWSRNALRGLKKQIGVAKWQAQFVKSLPKDLKDSLPSIEELEKELSTTRGQQR
jgi:predicted nuclease of restriction endonuclease-like (RecB) superfamily